MPDNAINDVAILGAGGMGTAMAVLFARAGCRVKLWCRDRDRARDMQRTRINETHLPHATLPDLVEVSGDPTTVVPPAQIVVVAIPSKYLRHTLEEIASQTRISSPVMSVVKGIELETFARPSEVMTATLGAHPIAVLSGPSHAEELTKGLPASMVVASDDESLNLQVQEVLNSSSLRVYTNSDMLGVELAGAMKNILGVAAGICDGLGFGDNAKAALLTRGLVEIARFACDLGARPATFLGLAGVGDLITTCYSPFGRNRAVGYQIGLGKSLEEILSGMTDVAEGVTTAKSVHLMSEARGLEMPITNEVYAILYENKPARAAVIDLMMRLPKVEWP